MRPLCNGGLCAELNRLRVKRKMQWVTLAELSGVSASALQQAFARGSDNWCVKHIDTLAPVLGADPDELHARYQIVPKDMRVRIPEGGNGRFKKIIEAIRAGVPDDEICAEWKGLTPEVLRVYKKAAKGALSDFSPRGAQAHWSGVEMLSQAIFGRGASHKDVERWLDEIGNGLDDY